LARRMRHTALPCRTPRVLGRPLGNTTVTETAPPGLTLVSMAGTGWNCPGTICSRNDVLNSGSSYPAITVTVNVGIAASSPQLNAVNLSTNGSAVAAAKDLTVIIARSRCDLNGTGQINVADVQTVINMALGVTPATAAGDFNGDGVVNIVDVQFMINVVLGIATCPN
jgi:large repetitive protein